MSKRVLSATVGGLGILAAAALVVAGLVIGRARSSGYVGSENCRECHERFYELWSSSRHGTAMQPFGAELAASLVHSDSVVRVGRSSFRYERRGDAGSIVEFSGDREREYRILHALGGKNVYYFLTELDRGHLQVLPLAYDVRRAEWFDAPASMVRHFGNGSDAPLDWKDRLLTFNTSCYGCHVSQLSTNYEPADDSYRTVWAEPGINCETCHGPGARHIEVARAAGADRVPDPLEIIRVRAFSGAQVNSLCATCHAKAQVLSTEFVPGDSYFDHYGLVTLEHPDFYPDGRDLGENYTYTGWLMSPCEQAGQLDCLHCHTSSGRYRFAEETPNAACAPCHDATVAAAASHSHHESGTGADRCISCHMPVTEFARMRRSDHSMLPPAPAATLEFGSPNACNVCHTDRDAEWADRWVRRWYGDSYQTPVLERARLVSAARDGDWSRLPDMLAYVRSPKRDPVFATALIRLLANCDCDTKWPGIRAAALEDPAPLVRSAAAHALAGGPNSANAAALLRAIDDSVRLVRIEVAYALSNYPRELIATEQASELRQAFTEYAASLVARPDNWTSHYNAGNFYLNRGDARLAVQAFEKASQLRPDAIAPLVNASIAYAALREPENAAASLRRALDLEPDNAAANLNLGLLSAEQGRKREAAAALRKALETDSNSAVAAYNLSVILAPDDIDAAIRWASRASELQPDTPRYAFTHAFYLYQSGDTGTARTVLERLISARPSYADAYVLLGRLYDAGGNRTEATALYRRALDVPGMSDQDRYRFAAMLREREQQ